MQLGVAVLLEVLPVQVGLGGFPELDDALRRVLGIELDEAVLVVARSHAAQAGVVLDDLLLTLEDEEVPQALDLVAPAMAVALEHDLVTVFEGDRCTITSHRHIGDDKC